MDTFKVRITRTEFHVQVIEVDADNESDAHDAALSEAKWSNETVECATEDVQQVSPA